MKGAFLGGKVTLTLEPSADGLAEARWEAHDPECAALLPGLVNTLAARLRSHGQVPVAVQGIVVAADLWRALTQSSVARTFGFQVVAD